jgi:hypothetical protein
MKALSSVPLHSTLNKVLESLHSPECVPIPLESSTYMRPIEIKRFIHHLRQYRRYSYTRDFLY